MICTLFPRKQRSRKPPSEEISRLVCVCLAPPPFLYMTLPPLVHWGRYDSNYHCLTPYALLNILLFYSSGPSPLSYTRQQLRMPSSWCGCDSRRPSPWDSAPPSPPLATGCRSVGRTQTDTSYTSAGVTGNFIARKFCRYYFF